MPQDRRRCTEQNDKLPRVVATSETFATQLLEHRRKSL